MSITRSEQIACACGHTIEIAIVDSLNGERHSHLRAQVLARELHVGRCAGCARTITVEHRFLYVDLARRQVFGVFPRGKRAEADTHAHAVEDMFERWFRHDAPAWIRALAGRCLVRACFGLEELREKLVADEARLDDLRLEALKCELLAADPELRAHGVLTLRLDRVDGDVLELVAVDGDELPCGVARIQRAALAALPATDALLAAYPGIAAGPHVSMLRLVRYSS